ncbi:hypothetical protein QUF58_06410 [Anaerolineales bacterium HSG24]|nr:hypothetical protein [Anaerolineales bacterium HSG24]
MKTIKFSEISSTILKEIVQLQERGISTNYDWLQTTNVILTELEEIQLKSIQDRLLGYETSLMNEATIWARAIYPLLVLAEQENIQAWAGIAIQTSYPHVELQGVVDGMLCRSVAGQPEQPYLVVVEAKRGLEAKNPRFQLYGELLAVAHLNWESNAEPSQEIFGCYTIGDSWTFLRAIIQDIDTKRPQLTLESSREYVEKIEAETILKILKLIVMRQINVL